MKKLLVLMLVLGMATVANAALTLDISVSGAVANPDGSYTIHPSDHLTLDISTPQGILVDADMGDFIMVCDTELGSISGGVIVNHNTWWVDFLSDDAVSAGAPVPDGENGVWGSVGIFGYTIPATSLLFSGIDFHCEGLGTTVVNIYTHDWSEITGTLASVTIHQIPEPITMALLGLGGLFLRRRK
jgi:hypothetical protein